MKTSTKFSLFGISIILVVLTLMTWDVSPTMNLLRYVLLWALLLTFVLIGLIVIQVKARLPWRLLSVAVALVLSCRACSQFSSISAICKVQSDYTRGLRWFVGDLQKMSVAGRTDEVVHACERFQTDFNIWYEGEPVSNFWKLVLETSEIAEATNHAGACVETPVSLRKSLIGFRKYLEIVS